MPENLPSTWAKVTAVATCLIAIVAIAGVAFHSCQLYETRLARRLELASEAYRQLMNAEARGELFVVLSKTPEELKRFKEELSEEEQLAVVNTVSRFNWLARLVNQNLVDPDNAFNDFAWELTRAWQLLEKHVSAEQKSGRIAYGSHFKELAEEWQYRALPIEPPFSPPADLRVVSISAPTSAKSGGSILVTFTVTNQGSSPTGPFTNRVSLATSAWGSDYPLGDFSMRSLGAGAFQKSTVVVTIPSVPPGYYYVTVFTDSLREVSESDEANNIGSSSPSKVSVDGVSIPSIMDVGISSQTNPWPPQTFSEAKPGDRINTWYDISYSGPRITVRLRTTILDPNGRELGNPLGDTFLVLMEDTPQHTGWVGVTFEIPAEAIRGTCDVKFSIWSQDSARQYDEAVKIGWLRLALEEEVQRATAAGHELAKFSAYDRVRTIANVNVRTGLGTGYPEITDPGYLGYAPTGSTGVVLPRPMSADGYV